MIRRLIAFVVLVWLGGFVWFAGVLPQPDSAARGDAVVVPTGSGGRISRGLELLRAGVVDQMLVTGVDAAVKENEFEAEFGVDHPLMECCITLGYIAVDTRGNALETADWVATHEHGSLVLVTADWHMRRAALELAAQLPPDIVIVPDAVRSEASLWTFFLEYNKFLVAFVVTPFR
ncbi:YdcF family protein [Aurantiacibacter flavus]|uniref:YdcF family protein n=1 Tax=Aurantiacibacter flavus TaxID=3145232 RepID=A0ABV0D0Q4_9SPHN